MIKAAPKDVSPCGNDSIKVVMDVRPAADAPIEESVFILGEVSTKTPEQVKEDLAEKIKLRYRADTPVLLMFRDMIANSQIFELDVPAAGVAGN